MDLQLLEAWRLSKLNLDTAKAEELRARNALFAHAFPNAKIGTNRCDVRDGWKLKGTLPLNYKLDAAQMPAILDELKKLGKSEVIKIDYELSLKEYKAAPAEVQKLLVPALTTKPGTPSLELEPPKEK